MASRPLVGVYSDNKTSGQSVVLPGVFVAPIRSDIVHDVHTRMAKNKRQPYAVSKFAGHQTSAESWGTGRAVARIPRVSGGGTHRAGQGAFGNMCRKGRMFAPTKVWRRWHRKININEKRFALVSSLAASAVPALVMARGHRIDNLPEVPLVVDNKVIDNVDKTSKAVALLKALNAFDDVERSKESRNVRAGKGKMRNRRYVQRRGPLLVYLQENSPMTKAFRNLPGVEICNVTRLNLLQLAPGGHLGRFVIWARDAFERLDSLYGSSRKASQEKTDYRLPRPTMTNADLARLLSSDEIRSVIRPKIPQGRRPAARVKKNPLTNLGVRIKLNPHHQVLARKSAVTEEKQLKKKAELLEQKRKGVKPKVDPKVAAELDKKKKERKANAKKLYKQGAPFRKILLE